MSVEAVMIGYKSYEIQFETFAMLTDWTPEARCTFKDNTEANIPLTTLWNQILRASTSDTVILLNADVWVTPKWARGILRAFRDPKIAVAGPGSNAGTQYVDIGTNQIPFPPTRGWLTRASEDAYERYKGQLWDKDIHGYCYAVRRRTWNELGGFDERIPFYGNETEYNSRVVKSGNRVVKCADSYVFHLGKHSFQKLSREGQSLLLPAVS